MKKTYSPRLIAALLAALSFTSPLSAAVIIGNPNDRSITGTSAGDGAIGTGATVISSGQATLQVNRNSGGIAELAVLVFQLPTLAPGESFSSVTLTITQTVASNGPLGANVDLYGLNRRATSDVTTGDYFIGANDSTDATFLQNNWFSTTGGTYGTGSYTSNDITAYLNAQYAGGTGANQYVFLRLSPDAFNTTNRLTIASADNATAANRPMLTYSVIPEPSVAFLGSIGFALLLARRRTGGASDAAGV